MASATLLAVVGGAAVTAARDGRDGATEVATAATGCPWLDSSETVAERVTQLERSATRLQLATMMELIDPTNGHEGSTVAVPALCMPAITEQDADVGVSGTDPASSADTLFASEEDLAATFDPSLARQVGKVIGTQAKAQGDDFTMGPMVNIVRNSEWGRTYETFGEDPYLDTQMGVSDVAGIESAGEPTIVKHYVAYNQEEHRYAPGLDNSVIGAQELHEDELPAFAAIIADDHPAGIMCAMNDVNGTPNCANKDTLDTILRGELHFTGFVRTDCLSDRMDSLAESRASIATGVSQSKCASPGLYDATRVARHFTKAQIDEAITPYLTELFANDLVARPRTGALTTRVDEDEGSALAVEESEQGTVLLKNSGALPLQSTETVALIGATGASPQLAGGGSSQVFPTERALNDNLESAMRAKIGSRLRYVAVTAGHTTSTGSSTNQQPTVLNLAAALTAAAASKVAVVVVNQSEEEGTDLTSLSLSPAQTLLITAVEAVNADTVVVVESGGALAMPWASEPHITGIFEQWYPGQGSGRAMTALLYGTANPSGKLPLTFPTSETAQPDPTGPTFDSGVPARVQGRAGRDIVYTEGVDGGYKWYEDPDAVGDDVTPLYPFGYGLSYSTFGFSDESAVTDADGSVTVTAAVTNTSGRRGTDVAQLYLGQPHKMPAGGSQYEPARELRGFERVTVAAHQTKQVTFVVTEGDLAHWDPTGTTWADFAGRYTFYVGDSSVDLPLQASVDHAAVRLGADSGPTAQT